MGTQREKHGDEWLTVDEAAAELRVGRNTLYNAIATTHPPWALRIGKVIRIHRARLLASLDQWGPRG